MVEQREHDESTVSRRALLGGAAAAAVGGVAIAAAGPAASAAAHGNGVARGPAGATVAEFRGRIAQTGTTGEVFTSFGYLTKLRGADDDDLFAGAPKGEATALFTAYATGNLVQRLFDQAVHVLDVVGELTVYQRQAAGATFADPESFRHGTAVARYSLEIQDVLSVIAPGKGVLNMSGDMHQTSARALSAGLSGKRFGAVNERLRQTAAGLGTLIDPATSNSVLEFGGSWAAV